MNKTKALLAMLLIASPLSAENFDPEANSRTPSEYEQRWLYVENIFLRKTNYLNAAISGSIAALLVGSCFFPFERNKNVSPLKDSNFLGFFLKYKFSCIMTVNLLLAFVLASLAIEESFAVARLETILEMDSKTASLVLPKEIIEVIKNRKSMLPVEKIKTVRLIRDIIKSQKTLKQ